MHNAKLTNTLLAAHFKLFSASSLQIVEEVEYISSVLYASAVGSLMYTMVCSRLDLSHALSIVSRDIVNPDKDH